MNLYGVPIKVGGLGPRERGGELVGQVQARVRREGRDHACTTSNPAASSSRAASSSIPPSVTNAYTSPISANRARSAPGPPWCGWSVRFSAQRQLRRPRRTRYRGRGYRGDSRHARQPLPRRQARHRLAAARRAHRSSPQFLQKHAILANCLVPVAVHYPRPLTPRSPYPTISSHGAGTAPYRSQHTATDSSRQVSILMIICARRRRVLRFEGTRKHGSECPDVGPVA